MSEDDRQDRQDATGQPSSSASERVSVPQAADHLGTTVDAIRKRVQRGTIPYEKDADGRVWILLDTGRPRHDMTGHRQDTGGEMVDQLRDRIAFLERQIEEEREARRRADTILAQLSQANAEQARTIRAIEAPASYAATPSGSAPSESPESPGPSDTPTDRGREPESATDEQQGRGPVADAGGPHEPAERPWWRRMLGG